MKEKQRDRVNKINELKEKETNEKVHNVKNKNFELKLRT
jgi:hypothetical protein